MHSILPQGLKSEIWLCGFLGEGGGDDCCSSNQNQEHDKNHTRAEAEGVDRKRITMSYYGQVDAVNGQSLPPSLMHNA